MISTDCAAEPPGPVQVRVKVSVESTATASDPLVSWLPVQPVPPLAVQEVALTLLQVRVTAVPDVTPAASPFPLRLFLHGWGLVVVAVLVIGFAGALDALGNLTSADFIALVVPLTALLGVLAAVRGTSDPGPHPARIPAPRPGPDGSPTDPEP